MRQIDAEPLEKILRLRCAQYSNDYGSLAGAISGCLKLLQAQPTLTPPLNPPLTLEELREMDGEPVWLHTFSAVQKKTQVACWAILECSSNANVVFLRAGVNSRFTKWFCNYGTRWLAYRRKPEEGTV